VSIAFRIDCFVLLAQGSCTGCAVFPANAACQTEKGRRNVISYSHCICVNSTGFEWRSRREVFRCTANAALDMVGRLALCVAPIADHFIAMEV